MVPRALDNRLTEAEREQIIAVCNQPDYQDLPPSQIVSKLADERSDHTGNTAETGATLKPSDLIY